MHVALLASGGWKPFALLGAGDGGATRTKACASLLCTVSEGCASACSGLQHIGNGTQNRRAPLACCGDGTDI